MVKLKIGISSCWLKANSLKKYPLKKCILFNDKNVKFLSSNSIEIDKVSAFLAAAPGYCALALRKGEVELLFRGATGEGRF